MLYQKISSLVLFIFLSIFANTSSLDSSIMEPMGTYVGELQEKWQFPSDHLPIGMTFDCFNIVSWNVLDAEYMAWVLEKNSQGLSRSLIADEHVYIGDSKLTIRDKHVVGLILEMIAHSTHPRSILALQECSEPFIEELRSQLPSHFEIISARGESLVIDQRLFTVVSAKVVSGIFTAEPRRTVQDITIQRLDNGQLLRLVNAHLPGDPLKPCRFEFAEYLAKTFDPSLPTIAMGDMNFNELEMVGAIAIAFPNGSPFSIYSPYCTNVSPFTFQSKAIDHFIVYPQDSVVLSSPREIMSELKVFVDLLLKNPESKWLKYYEWNSKFSEHRDTLAKTIKLFQDEEIEPQLAIDLGCGAGKDTSFLLENDWKVIAVDADNAAQNFLEVSNAKKNDVSFMVSTYEDFIFPNEVQIINASYALPFCSLDHFEDVMQRMLSAISVGGRFCGHFFGPNDTWATDKSMVFLDQEKVKEYFKGFDIEYYKEEERDGITSSGPMHWHVHHIIAKKI